MPGTFALTSISGSTFALCFEIPWGMSVLGRAPQCDFVIANESISRKHAEVWADDGGVTVADLHSRNGTFMNGKVLRRGKVEPGSQLRFGTVSLLLQGDRPADARIDFQDSTPALEVRADASFQPVRLLSAAERRVFLLLTEGLHDKDIALRLHVSPHTVHTHVCAVYRVFQVHSRAELFAVMLREQAGSAHPQSILAVLDTAPRSECAPSSREFMGMKGG